MKKFIPIIAVGVIVFLYLKNASFKSMINGLLGIKTIQPMPSAQVTTAIPPTNNSTL